MEQLDQYKNEHWELTASGPEEFKVKHGAPISSPVAESLSVSFRSILQRCGDSQKGFFGLGVYMQKLQEKMMHERVAVVSDVRLAEEQKWLMAHTDVIFIKVTRDVKTDQDSAHRTETEVDELDYDVLIENNGTLEELYAKLNKIIK
jgi:LPS sulfotransferase NodH